jgi:hypothetical protein
VRSAAGNSPFLTPNWRGGVVVLSPLGTSIE